MSLNQSSSQQKWKHKHYGGNQSFQNPQKSTYPVMPLTLQVALYEQEASVSLYSEAWRAVREDSRAARNNISMRVFFCCGTPPGFLCVVDRWMPSILSLLHCWRERKSRNATRRSEADFDLIGSNFTVDIRESSLSYWRCVAEHSTQTNMIATPSSKIEEGVHDPFLDYMQNIFAGLNFPEVPRNDIKINKPTVPSASSSSSSSAVPMKQKAVSEKRMSCQC
jgi:hypothetical protein